MKNLTKSAFVLLLTVICACHNKHHAKQEVEKDMRENNLLINYLLDIQETKVQDTAICLIYFSQYCQKCAIPFDSIIDLVNHSVFDKFLIVSSAKHFQYSCPQTIRMFMDTTDALSTYALDSDRHMFYRVANGKILNVLPITEDNLSIIRQLVR